MRKQIAHQTLLTLLAWLLLQNFNAVPANGNRLTANGATTALQGGKSTDSLCSSNILADILRQYPGPAYHIRKIVLDAGHGGKDPGCKGASSKEKNNALAIVLKLGARIKAEFPDVEVIYTRDSDVFVELNERAAIANRNNADLFISVHCNSVSAPHIKGTETYVMGLHTAEHNLEVAKRENAAIFLEDNYKKNYGGYDPNSTEAHILGSVWQSAYLEQSILFASLVQQYAHEIGTREDKGVKQAGFLVLRETAMPSVLVEAGYLTNRGEELYIASEEGQIQMAESIFEAFRAYKAHMEGTHLAAHPRTRPAAPKNPAVAEAEPETESPKPIHTSASVGTPGSHSGTSVATPVKTVLHSPAPGGPATNAYADEVLQTGVSQKGMAGGFRIHLMSWSSRLDKNTGQLSLLSDVVEERNNGQFQYFTGTFATRAEAEKMLPELFNLGFRTAKVVPLNTTN